VGRGEVNREVVWSQGVRGRGELWEARSFGGRMQRREANVVSKLGLPELFVIGVVFLLVAGPVVVVVAVVLLVQRSRKREEASEDLTRQ
jgi:hypothetical protein